MMGDSEVQRVYYHQLGSLFWVKIGSHPYWPCMVSYDPKDGLFFKSVKGRNGEKVIYHVQYFGKSVSHGWTTGAMFDFEGKEKYLAKVDAEINSASSSTQKKKLKMKYHVPSNVLKDWLSAVAEAECALKIRVEDRHELYVFKYEINFKKAEKENEMKRKRKRKHKRITKEQPKPILTIPANTAQPLCNICEKPSVDLSCNGICKQHFHKSCVGIIGTPVNFQCSFCAANNKPPCLLCKYSGGEKCSKCDNFYHSYCLQRYKGSNIKDNICAAHFCWSCYTRNPQNGCRRGQLLTCFRCPTAFHNSPNCLPVGSVRLSPDLILCPDHFLGKNRISPQPMINVNSCTACTEVGELVCCEYCPNAYHKTCINGEVPLGEFHCDDCIARKYLYAGMIVWAKTGCHRWWPAEILDPEDIPSKIKDVIRYDGEFPIVYFGSQDFCWTHRGKVFPYNDSNRYVTNKSTKARLDTLFKKGLDDAAAAYDEIQFISLDNYNHSPYTHIRTVVCINEQIFVNGRVDAVLIDHIYLQANRAVPPAVIKYVPQSSCLCSPTDPNPCGEDSRCLNRSMLYECHADRCKAKSRCQNQRFQKRTYANVKIIKTADRGFGLAARDFISEGSFIIEYVGEVITTNEYKKRANQMRINNSHNYYFLYLDKDRIIDAGPHGNHSRYINHSCNPNCILEKWSVNGDLRIGIFALTDIPANVELTFNYQSGVDSGQECRCGASNCQGVIGKIAKKKQKTN